MARLNLIIESDDDDDEELPDISKLLLAACNPTIGKKGEEEERVLVVGSPASQTENASNRRQRPLQVATGNELLMPVAREGTKGNGLRRNGSWDREQGEKDGVLKRLSPRKAAQIVQSRSKSGVPMDEESSSEEHMSDFVVDDSESGAERSPRRRRRKEKMVEGFVRESESGKMVMSSDHSVIDLLSPRVDKRSETPESGSSHEAFDEDCLGRLRFSPPRSRTPHRRQNESEKKLLATPPHSPSKPELQSPSKRLQRIPPSPHRPSIDAFWSQEIINDWNDQHSSPRKPKSPRKLFSVHEDGDDEAYLSPSASSPRRRSPAKTPGRWRDKAAVERKKAFDERKVQLAVDFLRELDLKVADGRVGVLAESAGGVKVVWSKKLHSTAGRANWKRETLVSRDPAGEGTRIYRHHASIELAEKVIDDEERLVNVLAHEYCHLANFMISGIKNNPHGKEFKEWAAKTTRLFSHRNITVTTKHTYAIAYKYIWACTSPFCGLEYKRHSKSIDPAKHSCGACKAKLLQIQPAPRKKGKSTEGEASLSAYQIYVKGNSARVRRENPGLGLGEVMKKLGEEFRDVKARKKVEEKESSVPVDDDELELDGDQDDGVNDVFKKFDLLKLG